MATIKAYTDLEQSRKLAEFLPLESADMLWEQHYNNESIVTIKPWTTIGKSIGAHILPCWSLAALLGILSFPALRYDIEDGDGGWIVGCEKNDKGYLSYYRDNPVDTCYEMILKLHELKIL